jgi:hypothetical protein
MEKLMKSKIATILEAIKPYGRTYHDALEIRNAMRLAGVGTARGKVNAVLRNTPLACWHDNVAQDMLEVREGAKVVLRLQHVGKVSRVG